MILSNDRKSSQLKLHEKAHLEDPFLDQWDALGCEVVRLQQVQAPADSFRTSFDEVILRPRLEEALRKINPFLRPEQVAEVVQRISTFPRPGLMQDLLTGRVPVEPLLTSRHKSEKP